MTRRLELLQWFGVAAAPCAWATHMVVGLYLTEAHCDATRWSGGWKLSQITLTVAAAVVALLAEAAALTVYRALRSATNDMPGPRGRQHMLAIGGIVGDLLFFVAIILTGVAVMASQTCQQS